MNEFKIFVDAQPEYLFRLPNKNGICIRAWKDVYTEKKDIDIIKARMQTCLEAFENFLFTINEKDRVLAVEVETDKLLYAYYETRESMNEQSITNNQKEIRRYLMLTLDKVIVSIIYTIAILKINYSADYINKWEQRCECGFLYGDLMAYGRNNTIQKSKSKTGETFSIQLSEEKKKKLFDSLISNGYIDNNTEFENFSHVFGGQTIPANFKPIEWVKMNSKVKVMPNKQSLLSLLSLLGVSFKEITNKKMMNKLFIIKGGKQFKANNYTNINSNTDIKSEYDNELIGIIQKIFHS